MPRLVCLEVPVVMSSIFATQSVHGWDLQARFLRRSRGGRTEKLNDEPVRHLPLR